MMLAGDPDADGAIAPPAAADDGTQSEVKRGLVAGLLGAALGLIAAVFSRRDEPRG